MLDDEKLKMIIPSVWENIWNFSILFMSVSSLYVRKPLATCLCAKSLQLCPTLCDSMDCYQSPLSVEFHRQNTGVGWHFLLLGTFLTQGSNNKPLAGRFFNTSATYNHLIMPCNSECSYILWSSNSTPKTPKVITQRNVYLCASKDMYKMGYSITVCSIKKQETTKLIDKRMYM